MAPISHDLADSLDLLRDAIIRAQVTLDGLPGAVGAAVSLDDEGLQWLAVEEDSEDEGVEIVVRYADGHRCTHDTPLREIPVRHRIEAARRIPDLIDAAREYEATLAKEARETAAAIERRLDSE